MDSWRARVVLSGLLLAGVFLGIGIVGPASPTGFVAAAQDTFVSVSATTEAEVSRFHFDRTLVLGNTSEIEVEIANTGSTAVKPVNFTVRVFDVNNSLLYTYPSKRVTLQPGTFFKRTVRHTPHRTGTFIIRMEARIGDDTVRTADFLFVQEPFEPPPPEPAVIVRKRVRILPAPEQEAPTEPPERRSWRIDAPQEVRLSQGGNASVSLRITNTGNTAINNVRLATRSTDNVTIDFTPKILFTIPPGESSSFLLRIGTTKQAMLTRTDISYVLRSEQLSERGSFTADISPILTLQQLRQRADNIDILITDARTEIETAERRGMNLTGAHASLRQAENAVQEARTAIKEEQVSDAGQALERADNQVQEAYQQLFEARSEQLAVRAPLVNPSYILIVFAIIIVIILVGIYYYMKAEAEKRPKLLRRLEET